MEDDQSADGRARVVFVSLHLPDPVPDNAGVSYLRDVAEVVGRQHTLTIAPDAPANRRAAAKSGIGPHYLIAEASSRGPLRMLNDRLDRLRPVSPPRGFTRALFADPKLREALTRADVIDLQWPPMTSLTRRVRHIAPHARIIATPHDVSSQRFGRQLRMARTPSRFIRLAINTAQATWVERRQLVGADGVVVFSEKDRALLPSQAKGRVVHPSIAGSLVSASSGAMPPKAQTVVIVGPLTRAENWDGVDWFTREIWPIVLRTLPEALLVVAGRADQHHRDILASRPGVEVRGFVDDIESLYADATVVAAPIRLGSGVKFKVLDALIRGIPLVTTSVGAEGIGDGDYAPPAQDSADGFARAIISAVQEPIKARSDAVKTRSWAVSRYGQKQFSRSIAELYDLPLNVPTASSGFVPTASVVIPVRNGEYGLGQQLDALARQPEAKSIEVIVSDNGSTDRTRAVAHAFADAFGDLRIVDSAARAGVSHARNVGILAAHADKILICDADDEVRDGWVATLSAGLDRAPLVGGLAVHVSRTGVPETREPSADPLAPLRTTLGYLPYAIGANMGVRRSVALSVGGFDESIVQGHEETDFCWRVQQAGYEIIGAPAAAISYYQRDRTRAVARQRFHSAQTRILLWTRHSAIGDLRPISFKGSARHLVSALIQLPRLIPSQSRFSAARDIGWATGTFVGHLKYRVFGKPPTPILLEER